MAKNVIREIRNQVRAEARMKQEFEKARVQAIQEIEEFISSLYTEENQKVDFRFDGFQLWSKSGPGAEEVWNFLRDNKLSTDEWNRAVFSLTREQAIKLAKLIEEWNAPWEREIARRYPVDQNDYYNAYQIGFGPATGTEHTISVGRHFTTSWQWN